MALAPVGGEQSVSRTDQLAPYDGRAHYGQWPPLPIQNMPLMCVILDTRTGRGKGKVLGSGSGSCYEQRTEVKSGRLLNMVGIHFDVNVGRFTLG